jgi:anaerobic selenocysteine-containing dehydrogenase
MSGQERLSFCRICMGHCGVVVTVDDDERLVSIRGDHEDTQTLGYACFKGLKATEGHNSEQRILHPQKKLPDGTFKSLSIEQALDEISQKIESIQKRHGVEAIAGYKGGGAFFTSSSVMMLNSFLRGMGSPKAFSSVSIDQSAKAVALGRIGIWPAGRVPFNRGDVFMIVGGNPLLSLTTAGFDTRNPLKRLKEAKARGMKLIVIDPRRTETAKFADVFLQPLPGEDCAILAGMLHIILEQGWEDKAFCKQHADSVEALRCAVARFTPQAVAQQADIPIDTLWKATEVFASQCNTGAASSATGPDMSPHSNLAEHLLECLNVVCGRFLREGDQIDNPGALAQRWPRKAQVMPAPRWWEQSYKSRVGEFGIIDGELPSGILADEILQPGEGQVKCLLVHGGNPALAIPDQKKITSALSSLELLVTIDPFMSATAQLSDYILPPTMQYERADLPLFIYESMVTPVPFSRYTPAVAKPPEGAAVVDDAYYFIGLASRLGLTLEHFGVVLDNASAPNTDDLLKISARHAPVTFEHLKAQPRGLVMDSDPQFVEAADPDCADRFSLLPDDIAAELLQVDVGEKQNSTLNETTYRYRLAVRRMRDALNSSCKDLPSIKPRLPYNMAYLNPEDMRKENIKPGDKIQIESDHGIINAIAKDDRTVRTGVVSITHGFGQLPERNDNYKKYGSSVNLLISTDRDCQSINAMPRMSGIPVNLICSE